MIQLVIYTAKRQAHEIYKHICCTFCMLASYVPSYKCHVLISAGLQEQNGKNTLSKYVENEAPKQGTLKVTMATESIISYYA